MRQIINAIASEEWLHTDDRFSAEREYDQTRKAEDIKVLQNAIEWLKGEEDKDAKRFAVYQAG